MFVLKHKHALKLWRNGNEATKDTKRSFIRNAWAAQTAAHYKVVSKLSDRVWQEIQKPRHQLWRQLMPTQQLMTVT